MTPLEARNAMLEALRTVAPESEPDKLADDARFRDELDIDSMDFLKVVVALHAAAGIDIPEADYAKVQTMGGAVAYLVSKTKG
jgi:acyl carrier protein